MHFPTTPLENISYKALDFYIKRDDLLHPDFSGNKARKFHYFLSGEFLHVRRVVSFGSNQSNAMYSLSVLAKLRGWEFVYFTHHIPAFLKENPIGNYKYALQNGMKIFESKNKADEANAMSDAKTLIVQEGGRQKEAEYGLEILALELQEDIKRQNIKNPFVYLPSGTGVTALFLQKYLPFTVFTCSTVGGDEYLKKQWKMLEQNEECFPVIVSSEKKYHYGKLDIELYQLWEDLQKNTGIEFDLLYDVVGWKKLLSYLPKMRGTLIYLHQGGLRGNESMLQRYQYKYGIIANYKDRK